MDNKAFKGALNILGIKHYEHNTNIYWFPYYIDLFETIINSHNIIINDDTISYRNVWYEPHQYKELLNKIIEDKL